VYREHPSLHGADDQRSGFQWVDCNNSSESVLAFLRKAPNQPDVLVACNFTPVPRHDYPLGVFTPGTWTTLLDSDDRRFGGSGLTNPPTVTAQARQSGVFPAEMKVLLPPLGIVFLLAPKS
jgi:1,4-alpha-glucan branching enzyme